MEKRGNSTGSVELVDGVVGTAAAILICVTVLGNLLVIVSVITSRALRTVSNVIIVSMGVADCLVGCVVMPLSLAYEVRHYWPYGPRVCDFLISFDVLCTTSSILHICALAVDRYLFISWPLHYPQRMTIPKIIGVVVLLWLLSCLFAFMPIQLGWNKTTGIHGPEIVDPQCYFINNQNYALVTALVIFYIPLVAMTFLNARLLHISWQAMRQIYDIGMVLNAGGKADGKKEASNRRTKKNFKAVRTLVLVMGCFCVLWFPFFLVYTVHPFVPTFITDARVSKLFIWLGYLNSAINPLIYSSNSEFKRAFLKVLGCYRRRDNVSASWQEGTA